MNAIIKQTLRTAIATAFIAVGILAASSSAFAQKNATLPANASAKILSGISLAKMCDMNFDPVVRTTGGGTATVYATTGAMTCTGSIDVTAQSEQATASTAGSLADDGVQDGDLLAGDSGLTRDK